MDPDVAVARQLVDAFTDALDEGDPDAQEYAEEQLADFLDDTDEGTADEVLVALLDLPLDADTLPLLNEISARLARRAPGVVEALLEAVLGEAPPELSLRDVSRWPARWALCSKRRTRSPTCRRAPRTRSRSSMR